MRQVRTPQCWIGAMLLAFVLAVVFSLAKKSGAQQIQFGEGPSESRKGHVFLLTDALEMVAGSPQDVELRFRVDPGFHINSHAPKDELLLPTVLKLEPAEGIKLLGEAYPAGAPFRLQVGEGETLDVYQNEFRVRLHVAARRGATSLTGTLHYQACDNAACFPPRSLPVKVLITAK